MDPFEDVVPIENEMFHGYVTLPKGICCDMVQGGSRIQWEMEIVQPYTWPYTWITGVITLLIGAITRLRTGSGPACGALV